MSNSGVSHQERHARHRTAWLRAAVLGANDGIVSTASLVLGIAAANASRSTVVTTGVAGLTAGAMAMAVGEYVSVSSQLDSEHADIAKERHELLHFPDNELDELTAIYVQKGLPEPLAREVAVELHKGDQLAVHLAEELGITEDSLAQPMQAALTSAASFAVGAGLAVAAVSLSPISVRIAVTFAVSMLALVALGFAAARIGGADPRRPTVRTLVGGCLAMIITMGVGRLVSGGLG